jgi:hypothetical protein
MPVPHKSFSYPIFELSSLSRNGSEQHSENLLLFLFHGMEFRVVSSSAEWFGMEFREFASNFCSMERNSEMFSLSRNGSERNSESFSSAEQPEFRRKKPFVPSIPSSAELFFCRKFPTLSTNRRLFFIIIYGSKFEQMPNESG